MLVGSIVYYSIPFTHMMPEVFSDPECFDPERFAPPRSEYERTPFSFIGFGSGGRSCIGQGFARYEMTVLLATVLRGYEWKVLPGQDLRARYTPTKCPNDGLRIEFKEKGREEFDELVFCRNIPVALDPTDWDRVNFDHSLTYP